MTSASQSDPPPPPRPDEATEGGARPGVGPARDSADTDTETGPDTGPLAVSGADPEPDPDPVVRPWRVPGHTVPPPPRPGERHVRVPRVGIVLSDDDLRRSVDRWFHKPMIVLALLILPLLALEFLLLGKQPELRDGILGVLIPAGLAVIWLAFFVEFIVKITIAESRVEYLRRHWIDVAIIVLPLLRPLRIARVARTAKIFTLRGVGMKMARYGFALFLGVEAGERLAQRIGLRRSGRRDPSRMTRHQLEHEVRRLRRQVDGWEAWFDEHRAHRERFGTDTHFEGRRRPAARADTGASTRGPRDATTSSPPPESESESEGEAGPARPS